MKRLYSMSLLSSTLLCFFFSSIFAVRITAKEATTAESAVKIYYFHKVICESCTPEEEFQEFLNEIIPSDQPHKPYALLSYCIYTEQGRQILTELTQNSNVDADSLSFPTVYIDGTWLEGEAAFHSLLPVLLTRTEENSGTTSELTKPIATEIQTASTQDSISIKKSNVHSLNLLYFETEGCDSCKETGKLLDQLPSHFKIKGESVPVDIIRKNIAQGDNANLLYSLFTFCQVPVEKQVVPILFLGEHYLAGEKEIAALTEEYLSAGYGLGAVYDISQDTSPFISALSWSRIFLVGLLNGLNPCAISMTLLFLSLLLALPKRQGICSLAFLMGKYTSFLLLGLLFRLALSELFLPVLTDIRLAMGLILLVFSLFLAFFNLLDFISASKRNYGKIRLQLPKFIRKWNQQLIETLFQSHRSLLPLSVFLVSFLISSGEALCTGQIYLASILSWLPEAPQGNIPYITFLLYVAALCTPSAILLFLGLRGKSLVSLSRTSLNQVRWVKLANCLLFFLMAFLALRMLL